MAIRRKRSVSEIIDEYFADFDKWSEGFREVSERPSWNLRNSSIEPLRDMMITPREVLITVDLPFTSKSTVKVEPVGSNSLEITAKMKRKIRLDDLGITYCRGEFQKFYSHMLIPVSVNMKKMHVQYKKGILEVHLPRKHQQSKRKSSEASGI
ncbi:MAG TPA: Hsp20 family protein [Candidatus Acidoferrales bacterium]|nr:Hsp20 family protein [Candidatus Acidoferrales bacterium]